MTAKRCPWWRGHDWQKSGYDGVLTMRETCTRCGWHKTFNGATAESMTYPPGAFGEVTR